MNRFSVGVAIGYKDCFGQPCPSVLVDGDSVYALFPGSNGKTQAKVVCDLLNNFDWLDGELHV